MKTLRRNPMTSQAGKVVRDVLYGRWCKGNRIGGGTVPPFSISVILLLGSPSFSSTASSPNRFPRYVRACSISPTRSAIPGPCPVDRPGTIPEHSMVESPFAGPALAAVPRGLGLIDRDPDSLTFGSCDRRYLHYRLIYLANSQAREAGLLLTLAWLFPGPHNPFCGQEKVP